MRLAEAFGTEAGMGVDFKRGAICGARFGLRPGDEAAGVLGEI
jgi:hypothetical protein